MQLKNNTTRFLFFAVVDIIVIIISVWLAFLFRFDGNIPAKFFPLMERIIVLASLLIVPIFYIRKLYSFSWSYVSSSELISVFTSTTGAFLLLGVAMFVSTDYYHFTSFPRSTLFVAYVLVFILCSLVRLAKRIYLHAIGFKYVGVKNRTLIVGAGDAGEQLLRNILSSQKSDYFPVGFIDDNPIKQGVVIHGLKVLGKISAIPDAIKKTHATQIIVALNSSQSRTIKQAVEFARSAGVKKIKIAPQIGKMMRGEASLKNLKDVDVEDLLGRDEIMLDEKQVDRFIKGQTILVTGASGSIGSELALQIAKFKPASLILLDQDETGIFFIAKELARKFPDIKTISLIADICDKETIAKVFEQYKPEIVFHAAAYKHVPLMEDQPSEAIKNNIFGTEVLVVESMRSGVKTFVFISTDKAVNPTSVMGATKRFCEMICQAYNQKGSTKFISVRFGNVLDSRGSVIPIFREQIREGGPVEVTHKDMMRYFMLTSEACLLVMQAGAMGNGGEVFVLDMGKPVKILDLAREMIRLSGFEPDTDIAIVFTGIRPGEKLFEEILTAEEGTTTTRHQKIFMANLSNVEFSYLTSHLGMLQEGLRTDSKEAVIVKLKSAIPSYK